MSIKFIEDFPLIFHLIVGILSIIPIFERLSYRFDNWYDKRAIEKWNAKHNR